MKSYAPSRDYVVHAQFGQKFKMANELRRLSSIVPSNRNFRVHCVQMKSLTFYSFLVRRYISSDICDYEAATLVSSTSTARPSRRTVLGSWNQLDSCNNPRSLRDCDKASTCIRSDMGLVRGQVGFDMGSFRLVRCSSWVMVQG
jgi:hypothetical protein